MSRVTEEIIFQDETGKMSNSQIEEVGKKSFQAWEAVYTKDTKAGKSMRCWRNGKRSIKFQKKTKRL